MADPLWSNSSSPISSTANLPNLSNSQKVEYYKNQVQKLRQKLEKEKERLAREQYLKIKPKQSTNDLPKSELIVNQTEPVKSPKPKIPPKEPSTSNQSDKLFEMMQMMMTQQSQTQNMILSQLLARENKPSPQPQQAPQTLPPIYPPTYPPQQMYYPPIYPFPQPPSIHMQPPPLPQPAPQPAPPSAELDIDHQSHRQPPKSLVKSNLPPPPPTTIKSSSRKKEEDMILEKNVNQESFRKLRQVGFSSLFLAVLIREAKEHKYALSEAFIFEIQIYEVITAIQKLYQARNYSIYPAIDRAICKNCPSYAEIFDKNIDSNQNKYNLQQLQTTYEDITCEVTKMTGAANNSPGSSGSILNIKPNSGISRAVTSNTMFPKKFFTALDREVFGVKHIEGTQTGQMGFAEARIMLINLYFVKSLVTTIFAKPTDYDLDSLTYVSIDNLKILATLFAYNYRSIIMKLMQGRQHKNLTGGKFGNGASQLPYITEYEGFLYSDTDMAPILRNIKKSLDYSENLILNWSYDYAQLLKPL